MKTTVAATILGGFIATSVVALAVQATDEKPDKPTSIKPTPVEKAKPALT